MIDLRGQTILVAGSSRGIGAATARLAKELGAEVVLHGRTMSYSLAALGQELDSRAIACDGTDRHQVDAAVTQLSEVGVTVDALICTLGGVAPTPPLAPVGESWHEMIRTNLLAPVNFIQAVAPSMTRRRAGSIVTVSSMRGRRGLASPNIVAYGAAKAALENVTASYAKALAPHVRVNCVAPGLVSTDMASTWTSEVRAQISESLLGRTASADEIAQVLVFLASPAASFMTGQIVSVDGGMEPRQVQTPIGW